MTTGRLQPYSRGGRYAVKYSEARIRRPPERPAIYKKMQAVSHRMLDRYMPT